MDYLTTKKGLKDTLLLLEDQLNDLNTYSIYNDDIYSQEIEEIWEIVKRIKDK